MATLMKRLPRSKQLVPPIQTASLGPLSPVASRKSFDLSRTTSKLAGPPSTSVTEKKMQFPTSISTELQPPSPLSSIPTRPVPLATPVNPNLVANHAGSGQEEGGLHVLIVDDDK